MRHCSRLRPYAAVCALVLTPALARAQQAFDVVATLGRTGSPANTTGYAVNASGQAVGHARDAQGRIVAFGTGPGGTTPTFLGGLVANPAPNTFVSEAHGINASGRITGFAINAQNRTQPFLTDANGQNMQGLGWLNQSGTGSFAGNGNAVNATGQVTGWSRDAQGRRQAFLTQANGAAMAGLGFLNAGPGGTFESEGYALNDVGRVTGVSIDAAGRYQAFLTGPGGTGMAGLGFLSTAPAGRQPAYSEGLAINGAGQVAGWSLNAQGRAEAFRYDAQQGTMTGLGFGGLTGSFSSVGRGMQATGAIVGDARGTRATPVGSITGGFGFLHTTTGGMQFFDDLLASTSAGWRITSARAITDNGYVLARGFNASVDGGAEQALLLKSSMFDAPVSSVPEPGTWALLGTGLLGIAALRRRHSGRATAG